MKKMIFSYDYTMKTRYFLLLTAFLLPLAASCAPAYDYTAHVSEIKSDVFIASCEQFTVTLSCVEREHPYAADGITCPKSKLCELELVQKVPSESDYAVFLGDNTWGGELSFRTAEGDYFYSQSIDAFPEKSVNLCVKKDGETIEIAATSVKNEHTMSAYEALDRVVSHEKDYIASLMQNGAFEGEFYIRLLRRNTNYYYVGVTDKSGKTLALLLSAENGEILARRENA